MPNDDLIMREAIRAVLRMVNDIPEGSLADLIRLLDVARVRALMRLYDVAHRETEHKFETGGKADA
jgi:hypothetical protein